MRVIDLGRIHRLRLTAGLITAVICLLHWFLPQQPVDGVGTLSLLSPLYTVLLSVLVVVIASGLGRLALGVLAPNEDCDPLESLVFSFGLGMALVGFGVYALGLAGLGLTLPAEVPGCTHVYHQFAVRVPDRDGVQRRMAELGVRSTVYYPVPLHLQPMYRDLGYRTGDFPEAERAAREVLCLPIYPELTDAQVDEVVEACKRSL